MRLLRRAGHDPSMLRPRNIWGGISEFVFWKNVRTKRTMRTKFLTHPLRGMKKHFGLRWIRSGLGATSRASIRGIAQKVMAFRTERYGQRKSAFARDSR